MSQQPHHVAINHGLSWSVYRIDDNGGSVVGDGIPNKRIAERIARMRDIQLAAAALDAAIERLDALD